MYIYIYIYLYVCVYVHRMVYLIFSACADVRVGLHCQSTFQAEFFSTLGYCMTLGLSIHHLPPSSTRSFWSPQTPKTRPAPHPKKNSRWSQRVRAFPSKLMTESPTHKLQ